MSISTFFNETELAIFFRQTNFSFGDFTRSADGTVFALDKQSGQVFIGNDLLRSNVHSLSSISSIDLEEGSTILLTFKDSSSARIQVDDSEVEELLAELRDPANAEDVLGDSASENEKTPENNDNIPEEDTVEPFPEFANTKRSEAIGYLVSEAGMSVKDACEFIDELDRQESFVEDVSEPEFHSDGTMTRYAILKTVKQLHPGDRIHLEVKPFLGKLRVYDTEYCKLSVDTGASKYFNVSESANDLAALMNLVEDDLFDYMSLYFFCEDISTKISCKLKRVTMLKKL